MRLAGVLVAATIALAGCSSSPDVDVAAAQSACSMLSPLGSAADEATPEQRTVMAQEVLTAARRSRDEELVAAAEQLVDKVNTNDINVWHDLFVDLGNACRGAGATV